jgi:hypothetical protein
LEPAEFVRENIEAEAKKQNTLQPASRRRVLATRRNPPALLAPGQARCGRYRPIRVDRGYVKYPLRIRLEGFYAPIAMTEFFVAKHFWPVRNIPCCYNEFSTGSRLGNQNLHISAHSIQTCGIVAFSGA